MNKKQTCIASSDNNTLPFMRTLKNKDLEGTNIKPKKSNGTTYYYYLMPDKTLESLGKNRQDAITAAHELNRHLRGSGDLVNRILNNKPKTIGTPFTSILDSFQKHWLPEQNYSKQTLASKIQKLNKYRIEFAEHTILSIKTKTIAAYLKQYTPNSYMKHRTLLSDIFSHAISEGHTESNPVLVIGKKKAPKRKKHKHTAAGIQAIREISPPWLQNVIDIAILSLQRRSDLTGIHVKNHIDLKNKTIRILQDKTRNYPNPIYIEIVMGDALFKAIKTAIKQPLPCPYLIKRRPNQTHQHKNKKHPFAVENIFLSKQFSKYRDQSGIYDHIKDKKQRPSFHDLRGWGAFQYQEQGYPEEYIQALMGHADAKTTRIYTEGHKPVEPKIVNADLTQLIKKD